MSVWRTFRKRPVVIEAYHYVGDFPLELLNDAGVVRAAGDGSGACEVVTLEGVMRLDRGDWLIRGIKGELYPCKPDIFAATYDAAPAHDRFSSGAPGVPDGSPETE